MNKYIIKNCPCYIDMPLGIHDRVCRLGEKVKPDYKGLYVYCQDCTNCVMKQIVEKCKKVQELEYQKGRLKCKSPSKAKFGREILKLLDIQEVE